MTATSNRSILSSVSAILVASLVWFFVSMWVNDKYMEAIDPPDPTGGSNGQLLGVLHFILTFPVMPLLPMRWMHSNWGGVIATRIAVVGWVLNSLLWGCILSRLFRLAIWLRRKREDGRPPAPAAKP